MVAAKGKGKASSKKDAPPPAEPGTGAAGITKLKIRSSRRARGTDTHDGTTATEDILPQVLRIKPKYLNP